MRKDLQFGDHEKSNVLLWKHTKSSSSGLEESQLLGHLYPLQTGNRPTVN